MSHTPRVFVVVGNPGSGKDYLVRAVGDLGSQHASIVPKHTSRERRPDDESEMVCIDDPDYDLDGCDVKYENFGTLYGIKSSAIWEGLRAGVFQVAVVSNVNAINAMRKRFGELLVLIYVHSEEKPEEYRKRESLLGGNVDYVETRADPEKFRMPLELYTKNMQAFNHVLVFSGEKEDLYDQIFRLFRAYERGLL